MEINQITKQLSHDSDYCANRKLAELIVKNDALAVNYYISEIGFPIIKYIENHIMHRDLMAEFYIFISEPFDEEKQIPRWRRVEIYKGVNCSLKTYTTNISCRHFNKIANKERQDKQAEDEILDYVDYESLLNCDSIPEDNAINRRQTLYVRKAFQLLSEKDKEIIKCLIFNNMSSIEAFPYLSKYINPRKKDGLSTDEIKASWTNKQCQDAISLIKGRALAHLQKQFRIIKEELKNKEYDD
jgi:hypothetical protein